MKHEIMLNIKRHPATTVIIDKCSGWGFPWSLVGNWGGAGNADTSQMWGAASIA